VWKAAVPSIRFSNCCRDSLHRHATINTARSTSRLQHIVYRAVWLCRVPTGAKLCLESRTFEVYFMALDKNLTHATMLNSSAQNVLNFLQNRWQWCYCTPTWNFSSIWWLLLYRGTAHSTLHSLKCGIMPCLAVQNAELYRGQCTVSTSLLIWLHPLFFHINKIHLVNVPTEWCITNTIGMIKASWRHRLTNQLSLYVQRPAVSGPRNFRTSRSISISRSSANLRIRQLWDIKHVHNCIAQFQANRKMAASAGNLPRLIKAIMTSHTQCTGLRQPATYWPATTSNLRFNWWQRVC